MSRSDSPYDAETQQRIEETRASWNVATARHNAQKRNQSAFFLAGGSTLFAEEIELLGDLRGKSLIHLACNAGQDSLSLARLGANVTGVDLSDEAIAYARRLSQESGIVATFHRAELVTWLNAATRAGTQFDIAFASYGGVVCWMPDINAWARGVAGVVKPGGYFVCVEFHPLVFSFDANWAFRGDPYFATGHPFSEPVSDYVALSGPAIAPMGFAPSAEPYENRYTAHGYQYTLGETVTALAQAGFIIEVLREYPYANGWRGIETLVEREQRRFYPPEGVASPPLMFGLRARRAAYARP